MNYKFDEKVILKMIEHYVDGTYDKHYSYGKYQATDMILDAGYGEGFAMGNIMKYAMRFGKKNGKNIDDLLKIIHYTMIAIYILRLEEKNETSKK